MERYTILDKHKLQKTIHEYLKRREDQRKRNVPIAKLSERIMLLRRSLRLIEAKEAKVRHLAKLVEEFTGINVWQSTKDTRESTILAKGIFCKYGIETGLKGITLGWYIGTTHSFRSSRIRLDFQRSFKHRPDRYKKWQEFKAWIKKQEDDIREAHLQDTGLPKGCPGEQQKKSEVLETGGGTS